MLPQNPAPGVPQPGDLIGKYRILAPLGQGGMGMVFLAEHQTLGRRAAIKFLLPEHARDAALAARFVREARAANRIAHPSVVQIVEIDQTDTGCPYLVMEYLSGETLATRLHSQTGRPPGSVVASGLLAVRQIAAALSECHSKGLIHRDLKPGNIMLVPDPEVPSGERAKLLDFGVAKLLALSATDGAEPPGSPGPGSDLRTQAGTLLGTPQYMAPEQWRSDQVLDGKVDVYALGMICFQIVSGRLPFNGPDFMAIGMQHLSDPVPSLSDVVPTVEPELHNLVSRMLAKRPADRPDMATVAKVLGSILAVWPALERSPSSSPSSSPSLSLSPSPSSSLSPSPSPPSAPGQPSPSVTPPLVRVLASAVPPTEPGRPIATRLPEPTGPSPAPLADPASAALASAASVGGAELQDTGSVHSRRARISRWALGASFVGVGLVAALFLSRPVPPKAPAPPPAPPGAGPKAMLRPSVDRSRQRPAAAPVPVAPATPPESATPAASRPPAGRTPGVAVATKSPSAPAPKPQASPASPALRQPQATSPPAPVPSRGPACPPRTLPDATCIQGATLEPKQRDALLAAFVMVDARLCPGERVVITPVEGEARVLGPAQNIRFPKQGLEDTLRALFGPPNLPPVPPRVIVQCPQR